MTLVKIKVAVPESGGLGPASGVLRWTPTRRREAADTVVMPKGFNVELVNGAASVQVEPTGVDWVWRVDEAIPGVQPYSLFVAVPNLEEVDYTSLVEVNPQTLVPSEAPSPAWYAYVDTLTSQATTASTSAVEAKVAAQSARDSATGSQASAAASAATATTKASDASTSAAGAASSAATALGHKNDAAASAGAALSSKTDAGTYRTEALGYRDAAAGSASAAAGSASTASGYASTAVAKAAEANLNATGFSIGTVTTVASSGQASAAVTGVAPDRKLDLSIPRGPVPNISIGTVTTGLPQTNPGPQGSGGPQGIQGLPGDMVTVTNGNATGTVTLVTGDLPTTRAWSLTGNVTLVLPTPAATKSGTITLVLTQDATGGRTITWPAAVKWPDGIVQQPAAAANSVSVIHLLWTGFQWLGLLGGKSFA